jgi:RNA polymerase sigma-70 factor (ECF subfamily)
MPPESPDDALRTLYVQHRHAVLAYAEGFTQDRGQAEDIVQETFLRAWRHLPRLLADDRPIRPWLLQVARHLLIDAARAARTRPLVAEQNQDVDPAVDGGLEHLVDQTVLVDALGQLSERHRQIVVETFYADSPMHVTAARLGVPAGTARSRLHYALDHLRRQLDPGSAA